ncbi:hypothetical protein CXU13_09585 [Akkermansia muciniphila]|nr:hypothetical protein CXU12_04780 [Akkermansia muciniphila]PNC58768.1 hypothetical protein CXU13_09585 [Akkermansia muciniphila]
MCTGFAPENKRRVMRRPAGSSFLRASGFSIPPDDTLPPCPCKEIFHDEHRSQETVKTRLDGRRRSLAK